MKMSIKIKLPFIIFMAFIINVLILLAFTRLFPLETFRNDFRVHVNNINEINNSIINGIEEYYSDNQKIEDFINSVSKEKSISILVKDINNNTVFSADHRKNSLFEFSAKDIASINGKAVYTVETSHSSHLLWYNIITNSKVVTLEVIILFISVLILVIYLHFNIVKPLEILKKRLNSVSNRNNRIPASLNRNDEIGELYKNFEDMLKRIELSQTQQIEMISSISHDLKTPLTSVIGYVERLMGSSGMPEGKKQEYYRVIYKKAQDIEKLIEDFSDFTKNEADCAGLNKEMVSVKVFFDSISNEYSMELQAYNAEFKSDCTVNDNVMMNVDVKKLRRVFANLISNSLKYVQLPVSIKITCRMKDDDVVFTVEDNGSGVPEEELSNIFDKFYRIDKSRSPEKGGTGLGLAICKSAIESHGGRIRARNLPNRGLAIEFSIPPG